jgi:glutamate synthase (NADPH) small chain
MADLKKRIHMPKREPAQRAQDFEEVALGYSQDEAQAEANRCLGCKRAPCVAGCPVGVDIPGFIGRIVAGDYTGAAEVLSQYNALPAICGRVCPQESQCEAVCTLARKGESVAIGALERFIADAAVGQSLPTLRTKLAPESEDSALHQQIAVVGSGPASLTAAGELVRDGYQVTIFESLHAPGGVLRYGIPPFRLPRAVLDREINALRSQGVEIQTNVVIGQTLTLDELFAEGYAAVFVGVGAGLPHFLGIPGENSSGVFSANEFLTRVNLMEAHRFPEYDTPVSVGERVVVLGGGNVAMDSARCALRLGAKEVIIAYRRSRTELPARAEEVENAEEEGVQFRLLCAPLEVLADEQGRVTGLRCQEMELGEPDSSGRRRPVSKPDTEFIIEANTVIVAVGAAPNPLLPRVTPQLATGRDGRLQVNPETMATSIAGVFAGGDIANEEGTVIAAMGDGKRAAAAIDAYLKGKLVQS